MTGHWLADLVIVCVSAIPILLLALRLLEAWENRGDWARGHLHGGELGPVKQPPVSTIPDRPPLRYVMQESDAHVNEDQVPPFERAEPLSFVPPVQLLNSPHLGPEDIIRLDTMARLLAAGKIAESVAITVVYDGVAGVRRVAKGGGDAYVHRRDALRVLAAHYGWRLPEQPVQSGQATPIAGRPIPPGVQFGDDS